MTKPDDAMTDRGHTGQAPMLRAWGPLAERMATLVREHPPLLRRVVFAPRRALHAYAAFLHHGPVDMTPAEVAVHLETTHPRALLEQALPGCDKLYPALDRAGERALLKGGYTLFAQVATGPFASEFLASETLNAKAAAFYNLLLRLHPAVSRFRRALCHDPDKAEALDQVLVLLESQNLLDLADPLSQQVERQPEALSKLLHYWLGGLRAPSVGLTPPEGMRWVEDVKEVRALGSRLENCLVSFATSWDDDWLGFLTGTTVYLAGDDPTVAAQLTRAGTVWWIEQVKGPKNEAVPPLVHERLQDWAQKSGFVLLSASPHRLVMSLKGSCWMDDELPIQDLAA